MNLEDMKSQWKQAGGQTKNADQLKRMTAVKHHPQLRRILLKLVIESVALILFLLIYHDAFDGADKPLWLNWVLIVTGVLYIMSDLAGFWLIRNKVGSLNLKSSLQNFISMLKRVSMLSVSGAFAFGLGLMLFFTYGLGFDQDRYMILIGILVGLLLVTVWSVRIWHKRITHIQDLVEQLDSV